jgi:hypothetical protein
MALAQKIEPAVCDAALSRRRFGLFQPTSGLWTTLCMTPGLNAIRPVDKPVQNLFLDGEIFKIPWFFNGLNKKTSG